MASVLVAFAFRRWPNERHIRSSFRSSQGVRQTGHNRWMAKCPAHDDRSPSLSILETDEGILRIKCFAECGGADVLGAVGLELKDLYPEALKHHSAPGKPNHWHAAREAFLVVSQEALLVAIAAENIASGIDLSDDDRDRLILAAQRIRDAAEAVR